MLIYPAIDLLGGNAVRLYKGDYSQVTVYSDDPVGVAFDFKMCGAERIHVVDLAGAKLGNAPALELITQIKYMSGLFVEVGGGIRNMEMVEKYLNAGIDRVILGTAAVSDPDFVKETVEKYGDKIAVGIDIKDGKVAIKGWTETSDDGAFEFTKKMQDIGVKTIICTDISKDGAMQGTNRELYKELSEKFDIDIIASGGVSTMEDIEALAAMDIHGAILGRAYYTRAVDLEEAIKVASK